MEESKKSRKVVLIGNGFDLAHGLPTKYTDFLNWYVKDRYLKCCNGGFFKDENLSMKLRSHAINPNSIPPNEIIEQMMGRPRYLSGQFQNKFLEKLYNNQSINRWVDIEMDYYRELKKQVKWYFKSDSKEDTYKLQTDFKNLTTIFAEYVQTKVCALIKHQKLIHGFRYFFNHLEDDDIVVNFNYTSLPNRYRKIESRFDIIDIHGNIENGDQIIFGFGDEMDEFYKEIENLDDNKLFEHIKSFSYLRNVRYHNIFRYIEGFKNDDINIDVHVIGMSCGLSDRVLLSEIFRHSNNIYIHYYNDYENYRNTFMEISRHFHNKSEMRLKVVSHDLCTRCHQIDDD